MTDDRHDWPAGWLLQKTNLLLVGAGLPAIIGVWE